MASTKFIQKSAAPRTFSQDTNTLFCGTRLCDPGHIFSEIALFEPGKSIPDDMIRVAGIQLEPSQVNFKGSVISVPPTLAVKLSDELQSEWQRWQHRYAPEGEYIPQLMLIRQMDGQWHAGLKQGVKYPTLIVGALRGDDLADALIAINAPVTQKQRIDQFPQMQVIKVNADFKVLSPSDNPEQVLAGAPGEQGIIWPNGLPVPADHLTITVKEDATLIPVHTHVPLDPNDKTLYIPLYTQSQYEKRSKGLSQLVATPLSVFEQRAKHNIEQLQQGPKPVQRQLPNALISRIEQILSSHLEKHQQNHFIKQELRDYPSFNLTDDDLNQLQPGRVSSFRLNEPPLRSRLTGLSPSDTATTIFLHAQQYRTQNALRESGQALAQSLDKFSILQNLSMLSALTTQDSLTNQDQKLSLKLFDRVKQEYRQPFFEFSDALKSRQMNEAFLALKHAIDHPEEQPDAILRMRDALSQFAQEQPVHGNRLAALSAFGVITALPESQNLTWKLPPTHGITPNAPAPKPVNHYAPRW